MLTEAEIAEMVRMNERDHTLSRDERNRVRFALGLGVEHASESADSASGSELAVDASVIPSEAVAALRKRTPWRLAWLAAAVAVVIAGFAITYQGNRESGTVDTVATDPEFQPVPTPRVPTPNPVPTATAAGRAYCLGAFADFSEAMEAWRGVDGWSRLTDDRNPEPHLPTYAAAALDGIASLTTDSRSVALERKQAMTAELETLAGSSSPVRGQRTQFMLETVTFISEAIEADLAIGSTHFLDCDIDRFIVAAIPAE